MSELREGAWVAPAQSLVAASGAVGEARDATAGDVAERLLELKRRKLRLVLPLLGVGLGSYLAALIAFAYLPGVVSTKVLGSINVAYLLAVAQFVVTFAIAAVHARRARVEIDPLAAALRERLEGREP